MFISYAQNFEDVMLWRALKHVEKGFYIDIGAQHPVTDSVSKAFYEHGWRGIHVEPVPEYAALLREDRPDEDVLQIALGAKSDMLELYTFPGTGLSTLSEEIAARHQMQHGLPVTPRRVAVVPAQVALAPYAGKEVHWAKIDVEGSESSVLLGWDFSAIRPWIMVVEATLPLSQVESYTDWEPLLLAQGYRLVYCDGLNRFYVANEHESLASAFLYPPNVFDGASLSGTSSGQWHTAIASEAQKSVEQALSRASKAEEQLRQALLVAQQLDATEQQVQKLEAELTQAAAQLKDRTSELTAVRSEAAALRTECDEARKDRSRLEGELAQTMARIDSQVAELRAANNRAETLYDSLCETRADKARSEGNCAHLGDRLREVNSELAAARNEGAALRNERDEARHHKAQLGGELAQACARIEAQLAELRSARVREEALHNNLVEIGADRARLEGELTQLADRLNAMSVECSAARSEAGALASRVGEVRQQIVRVEDALTRSQERERATLDQLAAAHLANASLQRQFECYRVELSGVYNSHSWALTRPLRQVNHLLRRSLQTQPAVVKAALDLPQRMGRRILDAALTHLRKHPQQRQFAIRCLARWPQLNTRLRNYVARQTAPKTMTTDLPPPAIAANNEIRWRDYPASVQRAFEELGKARTAERINDEGRGI